MDVSNLPPYGGSSLREFFCLYVGILVPAFHLVPYKVSLPVLGCKMLLVTGAKSSDLTGPMNWGSSGGFEFLLGEAPLAFSSELGYTKKYIYFLWLCFPRISRNFKVISVLILLESESPRLAFLLNRNLAACLRGKREGRARVGCVTLETLPPPPSGTVVCSRGLYPLLLKRISKNDVLGHILKFT